jgi:four helix bundle protein
MPNETNAPHERLIAYRVARELLIAVQAARISDSGLRDQALRSALSVGLNIAEATGRPSLADQRRVYGIARGEAAETLAALDLAVAAGFCSDEAARVGKHLASRAYALLSGLMRAALR